MKTFLKIKEQIMDWLSEYEIQNCALIPDETYGFVVNVNGNVNLSDKNLNWIPVKFAHVSGSFSCSYNQLTSLEFCPVEVGDYFTCGHNKLRSLEFCPAKVGKGFYCQDNKLTSLKFCPHQIDGDFNCGHNKLNSLEFCPINISNDFSCEFNQLKSLEFCPSQVGGNYFYCKHNTHLKEIQHITDFQIIYLAHIKTKRILAKKRLEKMLSNKVIFSNKKSSIKI